MVVDDLPQVREAMKSLEEAESGVRLPGALDATGVTPDRLRAFAEAAETTPDEADVCYRRGVDAGARAIGPERFDVLTGQFWDDLGTRPHMRARFALAQTLMDLDRLDPESLPVDRPAHYALGSKDEAVLVAEQLLEAFESTSGAIPWLHLHTSRRRGRGTLRPRSR